MDDDKLGAGGNNTGGNRVEVTVEETDAKSRENRY